MTTTINPYRPVDRVAVIAFVEAIQEHERALEPDMKPGAAIGNSYADRLLDRVAGRDGVLLMARDGAAAVGFVCAYKKTDDDPLLGEHARDHGYIADLYVAPSHRRQGVARRLLAAVESAMRGRGCVQLRIGAKAANHLAVACHEAAGFRPYEVLFLKDLRSTGKQA